MFVSIEKWEERRKNVRKRGAGEERGILDREGKILWRGCVYKYC